MHVIKFSNMTTEMLGDKDCPHQNSTTATSTVSCTVLYHKRGVYRKAFSGSDETLVGTLVEKHNAQDTV